MIERLLGRPRTGNRLFAECVRDDPLTLALALSTIATMNLLAEDHTSIIGWLRSTRLVSSGPDLTAELHQLISIDVMIKSMHD